MTITNLFGHDDSTVSEANFEAVFGKLLEGPLAGVDNECQVVASGPAAMTVEIQTGTFITGGVFGRVSAQDVLSITAADPTDPRIDRVVLRRDNVADTVTAVVLTGTAAPSPTPPTISQSGDTYEISLAQIAVGAGVTSIVTADITDERHDYSLCGFTTGKGRRGIEILDRDLSQVVIENDLTETTIYSFTIPRGALGATGGFRLTLGGDVLINVAGTLQVRVKLGGTTILASNPTGFAQLATRYQWTMVIWCQNVSAASQKWNAMAQFVANDAAFSMNALPTTSAAFLEGQAASSEDTVDPLLLDVTIDWSVANLNLSFRKEEALLELLPAA